MKIFQIGFNKCGTRTIAHFFKENGLKAVHWDKGKLAYRMFRNIQAGHSVVAGYGKFQVFTDMEYVIPAVALEMYKFFPTMAAEFPDAIFIMNTRNREDWIKSRLNHANKIHPLGAYQRVWKKALRLKTDEQLVDAWSNDWDAHHARVDSFFKANPHRLIRFHLNQDSADVFVKGIPELKLDPSKYETRGKTKAPETGEPTEQEATAA